MTELIRHSSDLVSLLIIMCARIDRVIDAVTHSLPKHISLFVIVETMN